MSIIIIIIIIIIMATLAEVFPCFFLSCKANARVKPTKTGHGPHSSKILCFPMYCLFCVLCIVCVCICPVLLPPAGYPIAVNKYMNNNNNNNNTNNNNVSCASNLDAVATDEVTACL